MINLVQNVPVPKAKIPKAQAQRNLRATRAMSDYAEAHKALYGVLTEGTFDGKFCRMTGFTAGVSVARLQAMAKQLKNRKHG